MKQILDYLKLKKLGAPVLSPFEKFEGLMAAKVSRRGMENFVVAKWNEDFLTPDVAFDPNTNFGMVDEFLELYENEEADDTEEDFEDEPDGNFESSKESDGELPLDINLIDDKEEVNEELGGEELERGIIITSDKDSEVIFLEKKETFPIFEALSGAQLSEWLLAHSISHKTTLSKPEKVKICEKYVADLAKSE